jgi:hypothetical protein
MEEEFAALIANNT